MQPFDALGAARRLVEMEAGTANATAPQISLDDPNVRALFALGSPYRAPAGLIPEAAASYTAANAQPASLSDPSVRQAMGLLDPVRQDFVNLRRDANRRMPQVFPESNEVHNNVGQMWREWADQHSAFGSNTQPGHSGLVPTAVDVGFKAYDALPEMSSIPGTQYVSRSAEALGRIPGGAADMGLGDWVEVGLTALGSAGMAGGAPRASIGASNAMRAPEVERAAVTGNWAPVQKAWRARETEIMNAPPHTLQKRAPNGRFQKLEGHIREARDKAIDQRAKKKQWEAEAPAREAREKAFREAMQKQTREISRRGPRRLLPD